MNAMGDRHTRLSFGDVHVRHTWACMAPHCEEQEHPWTAFVADNGSMALDHARATGHDTAVITEARTVHRVEAEG